MKGAQRTIELVLQGNALAARAAVAHLQTMTLFVMIAKGRRTVEGSALESNQKCSTKNPKLNSYPIAEAVFLIAPATKNLSGDDDNLVVLQSRNSISTIANWLGFNSETYTILLEIGHLCVVALARFISSAVALVGWLVLVRLRHGGKLIGDRNAVGCKMIRRLSKRGLGGALCGVCDGVGVELVLPGRDAVRNPAFMYWAMKIFSHFGLESLCIQSPKQQRFTTRSTRFLFCSVPFCFSKLVYWFWMFVSFSFRLILGKTQCKWTRCFDLTLWWICERKECSLCTHLRRQITSLIHNPWSHTMPFEWVSSLVSN